MYCNVTTWMTSDRNAKLALKRGSVEAFIDCRDNRRIAVLRFERPGRSGPEVLRAELDADTVAELQCALAKMMSGCR